MLIAATVAAGCFALRPKPKADTPKTPPPAAPTPSPSFGPSPAPSPSPVTAPTPAPSPAPAGSFPVGIYRYQRGTSWGLTLSILRDGTFTLDEQWTDNHDGLEGLDGTYEGRLTPMSADTWRISYNDGVSPRKDVCLQHGSEIWLDGDRLWSECEYGPSGTTVVLHKQAR